MVIEDAASIRTLNNVFENDFEGVTYDLPALLAKEPNHRITVSPVSQPSMVKFLSKARQSVDLQAQYLKEPQLNLLLKSLAQKKGKSARHSGECL